MEIRFFSTRFVQLKKKSLSLGTKQGLKLRGKVYTKKIIIIMKININLISINKLSTKTKIQNHLYITKS